MGLTAERVGLTAREWLAKAPPPEPIWSDEPEMESSRHSAQLRLLVTCLEQLWKDRADFFIGDNLTVYFSRTEMARREFRGPDLFIVRGVERRERASWMVFDEGGKYPDLIIELLSRDTARVDRTTKKELYQEVFRTPEYFWYSPEHQEFMGFRLMGGRYEEISPDERGWRWSEVLQLYLGVQGEFLRYFTPEGVLVPTPAEEAEQERARADEERARADEAQAQAEAERKRAQEEHQRAERLAARLRALGIDPDLNAPEPT